MRTIFVTIGRAPVMHNIMRTDFFENFLKNQKETRIVFLTTSEKKEAYQEEIFGENILIEVIKPKVAGLTKLLDSLAANAINTGTVTWLQYNAIDRGKSSYLQVMPKRIYSRILGSSKIYKKILRKLILILNNYGTEIPEIYEKYKPDAVYATSLTNFEFDIPVALEAKRRKIKLVATIRSWDNLAGHGLLRIEPDKLFLQSNFLIEMAQKHQAFGQNVVHKEPYGLPHYDKYINPKNLLTREEFCKNLNLDPKKKIILYGAMGDFLFPNEGSLAEVFETIANNIEDFNLQFIFRAHPSFESPLKKINTLRYVIGDRKATYLTDKTKSFEMKNADIEHLINSIHHSDIILTAASTIALDGTALNKPTICIAFDGVNKKVKKWLSVKRFFENFTHFVYFLKTGATPLAHNQQELIQLIREYLNNPKKDEEKRKEAQKQFISRYRGDSGIFLANLISENIRALPKDRASYHQDRIESASH